jgi:hypothetical protein
MDLRNANGGQSSGPLEIGRPWDAYTDDQLSLMDHLAIGKFLVMGFCIGGPFIFYTNNITGWGPALCARRPDITMAMVDAFLNKMYRSNADFVFTVTRDFVRACETSILVLPDDVPAHPYAVAMEVVRLAPNSEVSLYPWKDSRDHIQQAVRHVRTFLRAHQPVAAAAQ